MATLLPFVQERMLMPRIDLNSDLGESFGRYTLGRDEDIIPLVSSCNIACGMHAGDPLVMHRTVKNARAAGIAIGAHPGYPDLQGFGRRNMGLSPEDVYSYILYQLGALDAFCRSANTCIEHVKPHGQLYNTAAKDHELAAAIAQAVHDYNPHLVLVGLANSVLIEEGKALGLRCAQEFFADRNYADDGTLVPRSLPNACIHDEQYAIERIVHLIQDGAITSASGKLIDIEADTICVHGDNDHALQFVMRIRNTLEREHIDIISLAR